MTYNELTIQQKAGVCAKYASYEIFNYNTGWLHVTLSELNPVVEFYKGVCILFVNTLELFFTYYQNLIHKSK